MTYEQYFSAENAIREHYIVGDIDDAQYEIAMEKLIAAYEAANGTKPDHIKGSDE